MKATSRLLCTVTLACLGMAAAAAPPAHLFIATENSPPSVMLENGRIVGATTDKVREIMKRAGVDYEIGILPFKRALLLAQTRADACVYSLTRLPERETQFKWVGPTHESDWTLFGRAGREYRVARLEDARDYRIGAYFGDVRGEALGAQGYQVDSVRDRLSNPRKLLVGRIDLWVSSRQMARKLIAENGWGGQIVPVLTFKRTELYLACNPAVPDALVAQMNAALHAMNTTGVTAAIERKYSDSSVGSAALKGTLTATGLPCAQASSTRPCGRNTPPGNPYPP
jgi:polar amino acid transport system substrate-binding protein